MPTRWRAPCGAGPSQWAVRAGSTGVKHQCPRPLALININSISCAPNGVRRRTRSSGPSHVTGICDARRPPASCNYQRHGRLTAPHTSQSADRAGPVGSASWMPNWIYPILGPPFSMKMRHQRPPFAARHEEGSPAMGQGQFIGE